MLWASGEDSDFLVLTRASDRSRSKLFEHTAERFKLPLFILEGSEAFNDLEGYIEGIRAVEGSNASHILVTDSFDVLVARWDQEEVISRISNTRGNLIISGEPECWPNGPWRANYPEKSESLWPYACGGQFCGTRDAVLYLMREIYTRRSQITAGGASQEILHTLVGKWPMEIDSNCKLFQCMRTKVRENVVCKNNLPYNTVTNSWPMFLHFNDIKNTPGIDEWYGLLTMGNGI